MTERQRYIPRRFQFFWRALSLIITVGTAIVAVSVAMNSDDIGTRETEFVVLGVFVMLAFASAILSRNLHGWTGDFLQGVSTEMIGAILSGFIILIVVGAAQEREVRDSLIRDAGSPAHTTAIDAVYELRERGLLLGDKGLLQNVNMDRTDLHRADLSGANLSGATLNDAVLYEIIFTEANLQRTDFSGADLTEARFSLANLESAQLDRATMFRAILVRAHLVNANLDRANLESADMQRSDLSGATLIRADLSSANLRESTLAGANLESADLFGANLISTNLQGTNLAGVDLRGANLKNASLQGTFLVQLSTGNRQITAQFDETTVLPDGTLYNPDIGLSQMTRFGALINASQGY